MTESFAYRKLLSTDPLYGPEHVEAAGVFPTFIGFTWTQAGDAPRFMAHKKPRHTWRGNGLHLFFLLDTAPFGRWFYDL